jgi:hypothetical protein
MLSNAEQNIIAKGLTRFLICDVLNAITSDDVLRVNGNKMFWMSKELTEAEIKSLQNEAHLLLNSKLWKVLSTELLWHAQSNTLNKGGSDIDLLSGKVLKLYIETIQERLEKLGAKKV